MPLLLASASPRRHTLLASLGVSFEVAIAALDETPETGESATQYVSRLALAKACEVAERRKECVVLGADTAVVVDEHILGKPATEAHFYQMMSLLSGREHQVMTGIALVTEGVHRLEVVTTTVSFIPLSKLLLQHYWATGEPCDKAGGYAIQGYGAILVKQLIGSYSNVVGLPLHETAKMLGKVGVPVWQGRLTFAASEMTN